MIFFVTNYDNATSANYHIIKSLLSNNSIQCVAENATKQNLLQILTNTSLPLFVMAHGNSTHFHDQNDEIAIDSQHQKLFSNRIAFVFACYTANELGRILAKESIYWGYTGAIQAPDSSNEKSATVFSEIFKEVIHYFYKATEKESIMSFLDKLKIQCDSAAYQIDELFELGYDTLEAHICLQHIWSRLRVWKKQEMFLHREANQSPIFEKERKNITH